MATAPPAARLLLVEVPGAWGRAGLIGTGLSAEVTVPLAAAADAVGVRVQLIRRPGRHPAPKRRATAAAATGPHRWALADPGADVVRWGRWTDDADLLDVDLAEPLVPAVHAGTGPQRLALVCTHARHDVCCALRGRPVAAALLAEGLDRQVWETSHLGGDRFAANVLLLPEGEVFGALDETSAVAVIRALDRGRLSLPHYRGRVGRAPVVQAAVHLAASALDDDRRDAVRVVAVRVVAASDEVGAEARADTGVGAVGPAGEPDSTRYDALVEHAGRRYRLGLIEWWAPPARLTCAAVTAKPARCFTLATMEGTVN